MPQRAVSSAEISSLLNFENFLKSSAPESVASVNSPIARALAPLTPTVRSSGGVKVTIASGVILPPANTRTLSMIVSAALTANC